jgi:hypothetical protein
MSNHVKSCQIMSFISIMEFMSNRVIQVTNHVIHVKSCHSCQIMSFMSNHVIRVTIHGIWVVIYVTIYVHWSSKLSIKLGGGVGGSKSASSNHLREWLFHSRTGVGVRNSLGVGVGVGTGVGANNLFGVDLGVDFYCLNFALALASNTLVCKVLYITDVYNMYIWRTGHNVNYIFSKNCLWQWLEKGNLILDLDLSKT